MTQPFTAAGPLVLAAALALLATRGGSAMPGSTDGPDLECHVAKVGGIPTFVVNGRPHSGVCYSSYDCSRPNLARRAAQFAEAGCGIFNFVVEVSGYGYSPPMWVEKGRWDFAELDARAHTVLEAAPNAMLLPRVYLDAPEWWRRENPGEMMLLDGGSPSFGEKLFALSREGDYPSLASEKWRRDMKRALETVIDHLQASDYGRRVIGYQLSGQKTEEWYHWSMNAPALGDYSPHAVAAFRRWLRERHGTDAALRQAWGSADATLDSAAIPTQAERFGDRTKTFRDPATEQPVIDFHRFWSDLMADTIAYFAKAVKDKTHRRKVVGAFYSYTFEFTELGEDAGHLATGKLIRCPDLDFVMAPSSYFNRNLPGTPYFRAPVASLNLHGKVFWNDFDQVSYKYHGSPKLGEKVRADPALKQWEWQMGLTDTPEEFVWMCRREVGMELAQGAQLAHFDIHGGYYEDPTIMAGVEELVRIREDSLGVPDRASHAEVLLLVDEDSEHYLTFRNGITTTLLSAQIAVLPFVAPYDAALLSDLPNLDTSQYKLVLVLNACKLDKPQRSALRRRLCRDGRVVVWLHAPGLFSESGRDERNLRGVTGIHVARSRQPSATATATVLGGGQDGATELKLLPGEQFRVDDPSAEPWAVTADEEREVVMALKRLPDWTSVYSAGAPLSAAVLRQLAETAGVHLYIEDPEVLVFASRRYLTLGASKTGGACTVRLPEPRTIIDLATRAAVGRSVREFTVNLRPKEVRLYFLGD